MKLKIFYTLLFIIAAYQVSAQQILPGISVKNVNGNIIISWKNAYSVPVATINIQRSYDSLKNFSTIGSVLTPQNLDNGYADIDPPYSRMYYKLFIAFEGGAYIYSPTVRVNKNKQADDVVADSTIKTVNPFADANMVIPPSTQGGQRVQGVFTTQDNNVIIHLPGAAVKNYTIKFFDDNGEFIFELTKLREEYLIMEKVNFGHAGTFRFEIYSNGKLVEKSRFVIAKDWRNGGNR